MERQDGGPAFPRAGFGPVRVYEGSPAEAEVTYEPEDGMSLRDWFAGRAMEAIISNLNPRAEASSETIAKQAYHMADVMLEARKT